MFVNFPFTTSSQKRILVTVIAEVLEFEIMQADLTYFKKGATFLTMNLPVMPKIQIPKYICNNNNNAKASRYAKFPVLWI